MKLVQLIRVLSLAAVYLAPIAPVVGAEIRFRSECSPTTAIVRLGDVADVLAVDSQEAERLAALEICPTPAPGQHTLLSPRDISDRLALKGVNLASYSQSGASRIAVLGLRVSASTKERPPVSDALRQQAENRVRSAIIDHLAPLCGATPAWQVRFTLPDEQIHLVVRSSVRPIVQGGTEPYSGEQQFTVTVATSDSAHPFALSATVSPASQIVVTNRPLNRGERISEADVRLATPTFGAPTEDVFHSVEQVIGREVTRSMAIDSPLSADVLQAPVLVRKRDIVTVYSRSPGIRVRTTGRSVEEGAMGDLILLESLVDRQTFFARVCGPQEAEIYARAPQAATVTPANAVTHADAARRRPQP